MSHSTKLWLDGDNLIEQRIYDSAPFLEHAKMLRSMG